MNDILDKLDQFFETQKENEQKLFFVLPILLFGFIVYYFIYPVTDKILSDTLNHNKQLISQINTQQSNILKTKNLIVGVKRATNKLEIEEKELLKTKAIMEALKNRVKFLIFNLNRWAKIYNTIPNYVKNNNLLLLKLDNNLFLDKSDNLVSLKMQITLNVKGNFVDVLKLIHTFEARKDLVKVVSFTTDGVTSFITINIYGAQL